MMQGRAVQAVLAAMMLGSIAGTTHASGAASPAQLITELEGDWSNAAQYAAADPGLKVEPSVEGEWLDLQHASFRRVDAPAIGEHVLYLEWRRGGPTGAISRQRLWSFRSDADGRVRMDFFAFLDGAPFAGLSSEPGVFKGVEHSALRGYSPECALSFETAPDGGWLGRVTAEQCRIVAASGRGMGIDARVQLSADGVLSYRESGRLDDGRYAFRVPPTMPYRFERRTTTAD
jgi:hypothetical protein